MKSRRRSYGKKDSFTKFLSRKQRALQKGKIPKKNNNTYETSSERYENPRSIMDRLDKWILSKVPPHKRMRKPVDAKTFVQGCMAGTTSLLCFLLAGIIVMIGFDGEQHNLTDLAIGILIMGLFFGCAAVYNLRKYYG